MTFHRADEQPGPAEWVSVALLCGCAVLSAVLELLFLAEFYLGKVIVPVMVLVALVGNMLLPGWGFRIVGYARGAVLPVAFWLATLLGLSLYSRPEGDLFVIDAFHQTGAFYALLLVGAGAGFATTAVVVATATPPVNGQRVTR